MKRFIIALLTSLLVVAILIVGKMQYDHHPGFQDDVVIMEPPATTETEVPTKTIIPRECTDLTLLPPTDFPSFFPELQVPDGLSPAPGGPAYAANIHQQGETDRWPSIKHVTVNISIDGKASYISYRQEITTAAGETRNCIFHVGDTNPTDNDNSLLLYSDDLPKEFKLTRIEGGGRPGVLASVLRIEVPPDTLIGTYHFNIGVCATGLDFGLFPITVAVTDTPTLALPARPPLISMEIKHLLGGSTTSLEVYKDGTILVVLDQNLRFATQLNPATRTWTIGRLSPIELSALTDLIASGGFGALDPYYLYPGRSIAGGGLTSGDNFLSITINFEGQSKTVKADAYLSPDNNKSFPDMPPALNRVYSALAALIDKTAVIA